MENNFKFHRKERMKFEKNRKKNTTKEENFFKKKKKKIFNKKKYEVKVKFLKRQKKKFK